MPNNIRNQTAYVQSGDPETVDDVTPYAPGMVGCSVTIKQTTSGTPGSPDAESGVVKTYQYVRGDSTMTVAPFPGAVMAWADKANYKVTTAATNRGQVAGICQNTPTNAGNYFYIQTEGPALVKFIDAVTSTPDATGKWVIMSATAGKADCIATAPTFPTLGRTSSVYDAAQAQGIVDLGLPAVH